MNTLRELWRRLMLFLRRDDATRELEAEMRLHRELRADQFRARGAEADEADAAAARRFGNATRLAEESRDAWGWSSFDELRQDVRYASRRLRQRPGFALAVCAVLALGIGATTAMFSAVDAAMLRPLPFARADELVRVMNMGVPSRAPQPGAAPFDITTIAAMTNTFANVAAYASGGANLSDAERPARINAGVVTGSFFETIGVFPALGRTFDADELAPGVMNTAIVSWAFWQQRFGGAPFHDATLSLNARTYRVIGVMPKGFAFPGESDLWLPMSIPTTPVLREPFREGLSPWLIARVAPGMTIDAAEARMQAVWTQYINAQQREPGRKYNFDVMYDQVRTQGAVTPIRAFLVGDSKRALLVLLGATFALLLIGCANVTNLLLSQGATRRRELAVRAALGASRARVVRQLLVESALLSGTGTVLGIALAPMLLRVLTAIMPASLAGLAPAHLDLRVLAFATALAGLTALAFGLWPALGAARTPAAAAMKAGSGHGATAAGARRAQRALVAVELALAVTLLVGAGLMLRSFERLVSVDPGIVSAHVATLELSFPRATSPAERMAKLEAMIERVRATAGVSTAGFINELPLRSDGSNSTMVTAPDAPQGKRSVFAHDRFVSDDYFATIGLRLLRGRTFRVSDDSLAPHVAVVSATMAARFWPNADPLGKALRVAGDTSLVTVVGVVPDVREDGLERKLPLQVYLPARLATWTFNYALVARGAGAGRALLGTLTSAVRDVDKTQAVYNVRTMDDVLGASNATRRANTLLITLFGVLALAVAVLGVYAVTAHSVAQRTREFGIRAALGASAHDLAMHAGTGVAVVTTGGIAAGVALAWALSRVMAGLLYGVTTHDTATFITAPLALLVVSVAATFVPARRATRADPVQVMRAE